MITYIFTYLLGVTSMFTCGIIFPQSTAALSVLAVTVFEKVKGIFKKENV